ncbi:hypothetical protein O6H91_10G102100 [Diphasiastrum complanatum]|uniref:Uncharacterized protein n=1 Tax=Diphasiastrum complanatum TaxID=34168 RepID=A0ACC2CK94_DIPCM|nr:hypothetical protein O6H91_10G102100 [Diphasiastrum complanatum]
MSWSIGAWSRRQALSCVAAASSSAVAVDLPFFSPFSPPALQLPVLGPSQHHHRILSAIGQRKKMSCNQPLSTPKFDKVEFSDDVWHETTSFRLFSYNILAQAYVKSTSFPHSPSSCLKWKARSQALLTRLLSFNADILCLQLDEYEYYKQRMEKQGYQSTYVKRSGKKRDGCGIFFKSERFEILEKQIIDYNDLVPPISPQNDDAAVECSKVDINDPNVRLKRDCVAIMAAFKCFKAPGFIIIVANTHLYWDPNWADVKLAQAKYLVSRLVGFQRELIDRYQKVPIVFLVGDFNSTPGDQVYNYLVSNEKDVMVVPPFISSSLQVMLAKDSIRGVADSSLENNHSTKLRASNNRVETIFFPLCSLYGKVAGEPSFTNCTPGFTGTLDYIFFCPSCCLRPKSILSLPSIDSIETVGGLPNHFHPSDHLPIGADLVIKL